MPADAPPARPSEDIKVTDTLRAKIAGQGVAATAMFEHVFGAGRDLWADDAEFEQFLATVRALRLPNS